MEIRCSFPFAVGLLCLIFYINKRKSGFLLISIGFFLSAIMTILLGSAMTQYLFESGGWQPYQFGLFSAVVGLGLAVIFTILTVAGLFMLYKEMI